MRVLCVRYVRYGLFVSLVNQIHHHLHHHVLLLRAALGNHQRQSHKGVVGDTFGAVFTVEDAVVVEKP